MVLLLVSAFSHKFCLLRKFAPTTQIAVPRLVFSAVAQFCIFSQIRVFCKFAQITLIALLGAAQIARS